MSFVELVKALSDPIRARIVYLLLKRGPELCVCDLVAVLQLPQSTVSRQLTLLRLAGLVKDRRSGVWMHYSIAAPRSQGHKAALEMIALGFHDDQDCREDLVRFDQLRKAGKFASAACCEFPRVQSRTHGGRAR